jgi:hypothetical protein
VNNCVGAKARLGAAQLADLNFAAFSPVISELIVQFISRRLSMICRWFYSTRTSRRVCPREFVFYVCASVPLKTSPHDGRGKRGDELLAFYWLLI